MKKQITLHTSSFATEKQATHRSGNNSSFNRFLIIPFFLMALLWANLGWGQTATYTISSKTAVTTTGTAPSGSSATYSQTYTTQSQMTSGNSTTLTLSGYVGYKITSIVLSMKSNASAGAGTLSVVAGSTSIASVSPTAAFNTASWYSAWSSSYVNITKTPTAYNIGTGENVVITIAATANSLYIQSYAITYAAVSTPTISTTGSLSAVNTTYGTASASPTTFSVSGANMTAGILVTPPAGYEVSTTIGSGYASTVTVGAAGTIASTPVYVRLAATTAVGSYSGNIVCSSSGVTSVNVATVSSTVSAKALTVTSDGITKVYGTALTSGTGKTTFTSTGLANSETIGSVTLTYGTGALATAPVAVNAGTSVPTLATGGTFTASNYTITYVAGSITVTPKALTVTSDDISKVFGATLTSGTGKTTFTSSGLVNSETIGSVTLTYGTGAAAGDAVGVYASQSVPTLATGGTFTASNYTITYIAGTITVTAAAAPTISTTGSLSAVNTTYGTASASPTTFSVSGADMTAGILVTPPVGYEVCLAVGGSYTSTVTVGAAGTIVSTPVYVRLAATTAVGTYSGNVVCTSASASTVNVATVASTVSAKALTVTSDGITKVYGTALTSGTGKTTFTSTGLANSETIGSVTLTYGTGALATAPVAVNAGTSVPTLATGGTFTASNYTITYVAGSITVTPKALTVTSDDISKVFGATLTSGTGKTTFTSSGLANSETIGSVTLTYGTGAAAGDAVGVYASQSVPTLATGGTFTASNYTITYVAGSITVTAASSNCITESFDASTSDPTGWTNNSAYYNTTAPHTGVNMAGFNAAADWIRTPAINNPQTLTFWCEASSGTANYTITIQTSTDDVSYSDVTTFSANGSNTGTITNAYALKTVNLNLTGAYYVRLNMTARTGGSFYFDDVNITCIACSAPSEPTTTGAAICGTGTVGLSASGAGVGEDYKWYDALTAGTLKQTNGSSYTTASISSTTNYYVTKYNTTTNCESTPRTVVIATVNPLPTITLGTSPTICLGVTSANLPYTATTGSPNQYSITWNAAAISAGFSNVALTALPATPIVLAVPGAAPAATYSGTLTVKNTTTGCSSTGTSFSVIVSATLTPSVTIAASATTVCLGTSVTFTPTPTNGGAGPTYQWKLNGTNTTTGATYTTSALVNGDIVTCVMTSNYTCLSSTTATSNAVAMTINAIPTISGTLTVCGGSTTTLTASPTGGAWSSGTPAMATVNSSTGVVTGVTSGSPVITYTALTGCVKTATVVVSAPTISGSLSVTVGSTTTLTGSPAGGTWTSGTPANATVNSSTGVVTGVASGSSVITYTVSGCSATATVTSSSGPCIDEGFATFDGATNPTGWTFTAIGSASTYTSAAYYGTASPSIKLDNTGDAFETPTFSNASELSFYAYENASTGSSLLIEGWDGSSWVLIDNNSSLPATDALATSPGVVYNSSTTPALTTGFTKFRFTFTKTGGNVGIDDFKVTCSATPYAEMGVTGNTIAIIDGDAAPVASDWTDFGSTVTTGGTVDRTFTIQNFGTGTLNLTGTPIVATTGDFTVTSQPSATIAAGGTSTFTVRFDPSANGLRTGTISIVSNDPNENPYNFSIQGTGTASASPWLIDEKFDGVSSIATINLTNTPGFTASQTGNGALGSNTTGVQWNRATYSLKFLGDAGSTTTVTTPTFSNSDLLTFYYRPSSGSSQNPLVVQWTDGSKGWTTIATIQDGAIISKSRIYCYALDPTAVQVRFVYTRTNNTYYGALDDVRIRRAGACSTEIKILEMLVDACNLTQEGTNESVLFKTGNVPVAVSDLQVSFPNSGGSQGLAWGADATQQFVASTAYITALNTLVQATYPTYTAVYAPPSDIIPANSYCVIFTGSPPSFTYDFTSAGATNTTYYALFCDNTNTTGRYGNADALGASEVDYTTIIDEATGCLDTRFYDKGIALADGAVALFNETSRARTYDNFGCQIILPIELESFTANCEDENVQITWTTASETNNDYFTLEKSSDLTNWNSFATIKGAGNSNTSQTYLYSDTNEYPGTFYYRLKQTDYDGAFKYFGPYAVSCDSENDFFSLYPNPASSELKCDLYSSIEGKAKVDITNAFGQVVYNQTYDLQRGFNYINFDISKNNSGLYYFKIYTEDGRIIKIKTFVKQ
jgi:hypothetical protein